MWSGRPYEVRTSSRGRRAVRRECGRLVEAVRGGTGLEVVGCVVVAASLCVERTTLKLAVDVAGSGVLLVPPYIALQLCGLVVGRAAVGAAGWARQCGESEAGREARMKEAEMAAEGASRLPRTKVAAAAAIDVAHMGMLLGSIGAVPATLVVLLAHVTPSCPSCWPLLHRYSSSSEDEAKETPPRSRRRRAIAVVRRCLAVADVVLVVGPRLALALIARARGHTRRAHAMCRRLVAAAVYCAAHVPARLSAFVKERALEEHAEPVAYGQLNTALAAWQLAFALIALLPLCLLAPPPPAALPDAWRAVFGRLLADDAANLAALLFLAHLLAGFAARLAPSIAQRATLASNGRKRLLLLDAARAASVPCAVLLLNFALDPSFLHDPFLLVADVLATLCVLAELLIGPGEPTTTTLTKQQPPPQPLQPSPLDATLL